MNYQHQFFVPNCSLQVTKTVALKIVKCFWQPTVRVHHSAWINESFPRIACVISRIPTLSLDFGLCSTLQLTRTRLQLQDGMVKLLWWLQMIHPLLIILRLKCVLILWTVYDSRLPKQIWKALDIAHGFMRETVQLDRIVDFLRNSEDLFSGSGLEKKWYILNSFDHKLKKHKNEYVCVFYVWVLLQKYGYPIKKRLLGLWRAHLQKYYTF